MVGSVPLGRRYGFAADHIRSLQLVTADGEIREVDAGNDPDLFWAIRGGKGNFGIVTALEFSLMPVARLYGGGIFFPIADAPALLRRWRDWSANLPEESSTSIALLQLPPDPALPDPLRGQRVLHLRFIHLGTADEGAAVLAPMRAVAAVAAGRRRRDPICGNRLRTHGSSQPDAVSRNEGSTLRELPDASDRRPAGAGGRRRRDAAGDGRDPAARRRAGQAAAVPNAVTGRDAAFTFFAVGVLAGPGADMVPGALQALMDAAAPWTAGSLLNFQGAATPAAGRCAVERRRPRPTARRQEPVRPGRPVPAHPDHRLSRSIRRRNVRWRE